MTTIRKRFSFKMETGAGADERTFRAVINTDSVDRDGEVVLPDGMIATDFEKSPTVFWNHDYEKPVARCMRMMRGLTDWTAESRIAERPAGHVGPWFPDEVYALMKQGIVNGTSIGFMPVETRKPTAKDYDRWGDTIKRVISKWRLLEFSITPLPANQDALITAVKSLAPASAKSFGVAIDEPRPTVRRVMMVVSVPSQDAREKALRAGKLWM